MRCGCSGLPTGRPASKIVARSIERDFIWAGLVGMADPIRKGAPDLIDAFRRAGITSIMLTGDQRATAAAVAAELGLSNGSRAEIVEAAQLEEFQAATADGDPAALICRGYSRGSRRGKSCNW